MKTFALLLTVVCAATPTQLKDAIYSASPDPTGTCVAGPYPNPVNMGDTITFDVQNLEDMDTETNSAASSACISITQTQVPDSVGGYWEISAPGVPLMTQFDGVTVNVPTIAWHWGGESGDTNSICSAMGFFTFNDGRASGDVRHDARLFGSATCLLLIPDHISVATKRADCVGNLHAGEYFTLTFTNETYPDFSFSGMVIREQILSVSFDNHYDKDVADFLMVLGSSSQALSAGNQIVDLNSHHDPAAIFRLGNTSLTFIQVFKIDAAGWSNMNPGHAIGATGGLFGLLNSFHWNVQTLVNSTYVRVTKDDIPTPDDPCR